MNIITLLELEALVWLLAHTPEITCEQLGIDRDCLAEKLTDEHHRHLAGQETGWKFFG